MRGMRTLRRRSCADRWRAASRELGSSAGARLLTLTRGETGVGLLPTLALAEGGRLPALTEGERLPP